MSVKNKSESIVDEGDCNSMCSSRSKPNSSSIPAEDASRKDVSDKFLASVSQDNIHNQPLTAELLAEQNELYSNKLEPKPNAIRAWAADLPEVPDSVQPILTSTHIFEMEDLTLDDETDPDHPSNNNHSAQPRIQETKDVFTETQKVAYVGLCYLTSLEVVHDFEGKDFTDARMSASNWQRKIMRMLYVHMDISPDEIKMIESLSKHNILPTDLVHQFTSQGETTEVQLDDLNTKPTTDEERKALETERSEPNKIIIDLCWTVMCDLFLICLSTETYDARSRVFVARITSYLSLDWFQVIGFEKRIAEHLLQDAAWETETVTSVSTTMTSMTSANVDSNGMIKNELERTSRNKQRKKKRYVMIGLATIGGGLILGLSAGVMAPVIAGGLGAILTTVGVTGTTGFLGGTAGIALITGGATVAGGRLGGKSMNKRMKSIDVFEFLPIHVDENVNCIVTITGWLPSKEQEESSLPFSTIDHIMGDHYNLYWEPEMLEELGSAFRILATEAVTFSIQQALAHTIMGALLAGLAWPLALTKLGYIVDNPWANALDRSRIAGLVLADSLMNRNLGTRPITLVGYSLGARVIFFCLLELARVNAFGLIENVFLFGTPVSGSKAEWKQCTSVVSGRFVNGYATNDWLLGFLFRTSTGGLGNIAGLRPLSHIEGNRVHNVDCTDLITGHLSYRASMPKLLKRAGFVVTSEEIPIREKEKNRFSLSPEEDGKNSTDIKNKHLDSATSSITKRNSLSSLSSGKASIQISSKATSPGPVNDEVECNYQGNDDTPARTASSSTVPLTVGSQTPPCEPNEKRKSERPMSDIDIIADIIANAAAAASSKSGTYSSLSSGKASIAPISNTLSDHTVTTTVSQSTVVGQRTKRRSTLSFFGSKSETTSSSSLTQNNTTSFDSSSVLDKNKPNSRSSLLFSPPSFFAIKKKVETEEEKELKDAGIVVKEIKTTLGKLIVPPEVVNPMPQIKLEAPQFARLNR
ncbi:putative membrane protein C6F6.13c [Choanephora cucurbitarum]|uniref:Putative membrane protein C6F6.13c n=1 Tax=Choanephora cucurbitarum TaxID=101091 RepID=A0A1C7NR65_9FUNG|nr:putative membrane protein C6F6.13c [Choanephora cucurbitarum]